MLVVLYVFQSSQWTLLVKSLRRRSAFSMFPCALFRQEFPNQILHLYDLHLCDISPQYLAWFDHPNNVWAKKPLVVSFSILLTFPIPQSRESWREENGGTWQLRKKSNSNESCRVPSLSPLTGNSLNSLNTFLLMNLGIRVTEIYIILRIILVW